MNEHLSQQVSLRRFAAALCCLGFAMWLGGAPAMAGVITLSTSNMIDPPGATGILPDLVPGNPVGDASGKQIILDAINYDTTPASGKDDAYLDAVIGDIGQLLYKQDGSSEGGSLAGSYTTNKTLSGSEWVSGTLTYNGAPLEIADPSEPLWAVLKDGNAGFVVWDLSNFFGDEALSWDGMMTIQFDNSVFPTFNGQGEPTGNFKGISGFQIYGQSTTPTPTPGPEPGVVPEPGSLAILGVFGLCGAVVRRRRRQL